MGDVISFRLARKARDRKLAQQAAAEARALHSRTKGQKAAEKAEAARLARAVEQSALEPADPKIAQPNDSSHSGDETAPG